MAIKSSPGQVGSRIARPLRYRQNGQGLGDEEKIGSQYPNPKGAVEQRELFERIKLRYRPWVRTFQDVVGKASDVTNQADLGIAESMGAVFWVIAGVVLAVVLPFAPPTEEIGLTGWVLGVVGVVLCFLLGFRRADPDQDVSINEIFTFTLVSVVLIASLEWFAGGRSSPYHFLYVMPLLFSAGVYRPRRVALVVGMICVLLWAPALYEEIDLDTGIVIATETVMFVMIAAAVWALFVTLRYQRHRLVKSRAKAQRLARHDSLTKLGNRRLMLEAVEREAARAERTGSDLAVLSGDLDFFKKVNDLAGHAAGDRYLRKVARAMNEAKRDADEAFRWAGDEFAVLMPGADIDAARELGDRINEGVAEIETPDGLDPLSFTFGYASFDSDDDDPTNFLFVADKVLVKKKQDRPRMP